MSWMRRAGTLAQRARLLDALRRKREVGKREQRPEGAGVDLSGLVQPAPARGRIAEGAVRQGHIDERLRIARVAPVRLAEGRERRFLGAALPFDIAAVHQGADTVGCSGT